MSSLSAIPGGMPSISVTLSEAASLRLETISFFLMGFLLAAWGVKGLWNLLQRDWTSLPRLSYRAALGLTTVWGLLFVLVLTMISGARELLTPGAWEKTGATYRLKSDAAPASPPVSDATLEQRQEHLRLLGRELLVFAAKHEGRFPSREETGEIDELHWQLPRRPASFYIYVPGATAEGHRNQVVAYEPMLYGDAQFVLLSDGSVEAMTTELLAERLPAEEVAERIKIENQKDGSFYLP